MEIRDLLSKPVWQMTGEEFIFLNRHALQGSETKPAQPAADKDKKYVYGIGGIARLFGCSIPTANRIKKSGRIDRAITQIGRKIIVDADMALELAGRKSGWSGTTGVLSDIKPGRISVRIERVRSFAGRSGDSGMCFLWH